MSVEVDRDWLDWARPIVRMEATASAHFSSCRSKLQAGSAEYDDIDPTLRWPGYVGSEWERGRGMLFIGSVHSDFAGVHDADYANRRPIVDDLARANKLWRELEAPTDAQDRGYLEATRSAYTRLIPHWPRADHFTKLMTDVFRDREHPYDYAAWTNLAHCRARPRHLSEYPLQAHCSGTKGPYPIAVLVEILKPRAILMPIKPMAGDHGKRFDLGASDYAPILRSFPGTGAATWHGRPPEVWVRELTEELR